MLRNFLRPISVHSKYVSHYKNVTNLISNLQNTISNVQYTQPSNFSKDENDALAKIKSTMVTLDEQVKKKSLDINNEIESNLTLANNYNFLNRYEQISQTTERISLTLKLKDSQYLDSLSKLINVSGKVTKYSGIGVCGAVTLPVLFGLIVGNGDSFLQFLISFGGVTVASCIYIPLFGIFIKSGLLRILFHFMYSHKIKTL
jgi:hypothetical protein